MAEELGTGGGAGGPGGGNVTVASAGSMAERSREVVRRFLVEVIFGGDERALRETVADPVLQERVWLFWAAFTDRALGEIDVLFADAAGRWVGCHASGILRQIGPYLDQLTEADGELAERECTGLYAVADGRIVSARQTWY